MIMGNATPGVVLGILIGKGLEEGGWNNVTRTLLGAIITLFALSAFFRGFDLKMLKQFYIQVPEWLLQLHKFFG